MVGIRSPKFHISSSEMPTSLPPSTSTSIIVVDLHNLTVALMDLGNSGTWTDSSQGVLNYQRPGSRLRAWIIGVSTPRGSIPVECCQSRFLMASCSLQHIFYYVFIHSTAMNRIRDLVFLCEESNSFSPATLAILPWEHGLNIGIVLVNRHKHSLLSYRGGWTCHRRVFYRRNVLAEPNGQDPCCTNSNICKYVCCLCP